MGYNCVRFYNFRNLENSTVDIGASIIQLVGENGQGKTNFLEAIYYLSFGGSFRKCSDSKICRIGESQFFLHGELMVEDEEFVIEVNRNKKNKSISLNKNKINDRKDIIYTMPCVVCDHQDYLYITGNALQRRKFFDQTASLYNRVYLNNLRNYNRILKNRNIAIINNDYKIIETYDYQLASVGIEIVQYRNWLINAINPIFSELFERVSRSNDQLKISYSSQWDDCHTGDDVIKILEQKRGADFQQKTTTSGIHRDRFEFLFGNSNFSYIGSTGQIRLASILLKIVQAIHYIQETKKLPILLVDDVLLEIDPQRRKELVAHFPDFEQIFFTFLPEERYTNYNNKESIIYTVKDGKFIRR